MEDIKEEDPLCINCWSGPRCVSTSLLYAFSQRSDTQVLDEPLYAHFLRLNPDLSRPYRDLVMAAQDPDGNAVVRSLILGPREKPVLYAKHMAKQREGLSRELLQRGKHVLLVRAPEAVLRSFSEVLEPTLKEASYAALLELYSELRSMGKIPPVVLSEDLVAAPEATLRALCAALGLSFDASMLSWTAGPKHEDGPWAPWWYATTHKSTGFQRSSSAAGEEEADSDQSSGRRKFVAVDPTLQPLLEECRPIYEFLRRKALRPALFSIPQSPIPGSASGPITMSGKKSGGTHSYRPDPRNADILVGMRDGVTGVFELVWRPEAKVSVLDSGFMLGDGVWEGLRVHRGVILFAADHFERLYEGAKAIDMDLGLSISELEGLVYSTLDANGMLAEDATGVHVRLMVTRGLKPTPYQHPGTTIGLPTVVILPEWKEADSGPKEKGIRLFTVHVRRGPPDVQDPGWNSHSKLNCIAACIQAAKAGADEALMLDTRGFVATCNSTNFFIVRRGEVWAPGPGYQLRGITRAKVLELCAAAGIPVRECDFYLTQVYSAEEAFVTGTFAGQIQVVEVDGRVIGGGTRGPVTARLQRLYAELCEKDAQGGRKSGSGGSS